MYNQVKIRRGRQAEAARRRQAVDGSRECDGPIVGVTLLGTSGGLSVHECSIAKEEGSDDAGRSWERSWESDDLTETTSAIAAPLVHTDAPKNRYICHSELGRPPAHKCAERSALKAAHCLQPCRIKEVRWEGTSVNQARPYLERLVVGVVGLGSRSVEVEAVVNYSRFSCVPEHQLPEPGCHQRLAQYRSQLRRIRCQSRRRPCCR